MFERRVVFFAREHAREFLGAGVVVFDEAQADARLPFALVFLQHVMPVAPAGQLREVRDARDLSGSGEPADARADRDRRGAADAGIDLVEDQRRAAARSLGGAR